MRAEELRIGNLVMYNGMIMKISEIQSPKPLKDKMYSDKYIIELFDGAGLISCVFEEIQAITLAEEWLIKLGFEKKSWFSKGIVIECIYYQLNDFVIYLLPKSFEIELINKSGEQFNLYKNFKKEVHILQNIFFALTQTELKLNQ
jgi:hypothetical protein